MALMGLTVFDTVDYVSNRDACKTRVQVPVDPAFPDGPTKFETKIEKGATIFKLAPLDLFTMGRIFDGASRVLHTAYSDEAAVQTFSNQTNIEACQFGLKGWENFIDHKTKKEIPFTTQTKVVNGRSYTVASDESMKALGLQLAGELGWEIKSLSEVSAEEVKNSEGA